MSPHKAMTKNRTLDDVLAELPASRRARIERRGATLIEEEYTLKQLRKARKLTQQDLAGMTGKAQANIVRLEKQSDLLLSTLRSHIEAMGGKLELRVKFPDAPALRIGRLTEEGEARPPRRAAKKAPRRRAAG